MVIKNKLIEVEQAMSKVQDGDTIMVGGFGIVGCPYDLIDALVATNKKNLTIISNDLASSGDGLGKLLSNNQVKSLIGNYYTWNPDVSEAYNLDKIDVKLIPQGSLAESIRAGAFGIPAYYTLTSAGTTLGKEKETKVFGGKTYVLEHALKADIALIRAYKSDKLGNLIYYKTARNFNPLMAMAAKYTFAEVEEIVETGELSPEEIITQHIFVDGVVKGGSRKC